MRRNSKWHESWHAPIALARIGDLDWTAKNFTDTKDTNWQQIIEQALYLSFPGATILEIVLPCMYSGGFDPKPIQPLGASQYWTRLIPEELNKVSHSISVNKTALLVLGQSSLDPWFHAYLQATHMMPVVCLTLTKYKDPIMARTLYSDSELWTWIQRLIMRYSSVIINPFMHGLETSIFFKKLKSRVPGTNIKIIGGSPENHVNWNNKIFVRKKVKDLLGDNHTLQYKTPKSLAEITEAVWQLFDKCLEIKIQLPDTGGAGGLKVFHKEHIKAKGKECFKQELISWLESEHWGFLKPILVEEWVFKKIAKNYQGRPISLSTHAYLNENGTIIFRGTKLQLWYQNNDPKSGCSGGIGARFLIENEILRQVIELSYNIWNEMARDHIVGMASPDWIVLNDGRIILVECNVRWSDTSSHDGVEIWNYPFDFMGDSLAQGNEQLLIKGKNLNPRDMVLYFTEAAIRDGIENQISFRFITPISLHIENENKIESKITVVISAALRNDLNPKDRIELVNTAKEFFKNMAESLSAEV